MNLYFKERHPGPELMDLEEYSPTDLHRNLDELATINKTLGGYKSTFAGLKKLVTNPNKTIHVLDIGCGGGDTIAAVYKWGKAKGWKLQFTGLDLSPTAIDHAKQTCAHIEDVAFIQASFEELGKDYDNYFDIAMCSLFTHHFYPPQLDELLMVMQRVSKMGFTINDLERNVLAWLGIRILTGLFSKSYLVKHDAPMSVQRGFTKQEWTTLLERNGIDRFDVRWNWAFRHTITAYHEM